MTHLVLGDHAAEVLRPAFDHAPQLRADIVVFRDVLAVGPLDALDTPAAAASRAAYWGRLWPDYPDDLEAGLAEEEQRYAQVRDACSRGGRAAIWHGYHSSAQIWLQRLAATLEDVGGIVDEVDVTTDKALTDGRLGHGEFPRRAARGRATAARTSGIRTLPVSRFCSRERRCDAEAVCGLIAANLGLRRSGQHLAESSLLKIGMATGDKRSQMRCLRANGEPALVAADDAVPLADVLSYRDGAYTLDRAIVRRLVDSATTADPRDTPSNARREARKLDTQTKYEGWQKRYRALKKQHLNKSDVWYSRQIAKMDIAKGLSADTIRKHMKR